MLAKKTRKILSIRIFKLCCYSALPELNGSLGRREKTDLHRNVKGSGIKSAK